ncbi:three-helix bundle dimerization domain-containing protein [Streptomyces sp. NPDC047000]|uniref:three-helix bundle dimerization domain-containing protein n=1 Tax=Streptomyces sp. NPDC047000 TaxID=3155474 RepID=UPI0033D00D27
MRLTKPVSLEEPVGFGEPVSVEERGREHPGTRLRRDEEDAVRDVLGRLCRAYGSLDGTTVERAVAEARDAFRQARVRAFVPILVERRARAALDSAARRSRPAPPQGDPLSAP